ncbi:MAG: hypothetical protein NT086_19300 [Proteobacteria bacterium]|jgi:hypothetical protein|nr:hypothetical protein [Pseudomonadota bacterium]
MGIAINGLYFQRPGLAEAVNVAASVMVSVRTIDWLIRKKISVQLQGSRDAKTGKPFVLIQYAKGWCAKFKADYGAEIVQRMCSKEGQFELWQFEIQGCLVQWFEEV